MSTIYEYVSAAQEDCAGPFSFTATTIVIIGCCVLGLLWALFNVILVNKINVAEGNDGESDSLVGDISE